jgi:hypothetical protein
MGVGADAHEAPPQAAQAAAQPPKRKGQGKSVGGASGAPRAPRKPHAKQKQAPGKVVAIGVDVPSLDDLDTEQRGREEAEAQFKAGKPSARGRGRPDEYQPRYAGIARGMCKMGASDYDLADEFEVTVQTIWRWRCKYPDFCYALLEGKDAFDDRIERSLAQRAAGYSLHVEKVYCSEGQIIRAQTVEHYPPDVGAIKMWLGNRRPDKWKDKAEVKLDDSGAFLKIWEAISNGTA